MKKKKRGNTTDGCIYGYPISEVWNTYHYLAKLIVPRLKAFKALDKYGYCPAFAGIKAWNNAIQKMIDAFELLANNSSFSEEEKQTIDEGLELFCKHFRNLWD